MNAILLVRNGTRLLRGIPLLLQVSARVSGIPLGELAEGGTGCQLDDG